MTYFFPNREKTPRKVPLREEFLKWQCRLRQIIVRENDGKPDRSVMPVVHSETGIWEPFQVITVLCRNLQHSVTPEMHHMVKSTNDPFQVRDKAIKFFSERYYQQFDRFSDTITATFEENSDRYGDLMQSKTCVLRFEAFNKRYTLSCKVEEFTVSDYFWQATYWHNLLFNPNLSPAIKVLGFTPDWERSSEIRGR